MVRTAAPPVQLQLDFDAVDAPRRLTPEGFVCALKHRRLRHVRRVLFKRNRARIITLGRDGETLHIHACFQEAPDPVIDAVATFLRAGRRSMAYRDALRVLREFWMMMGQSGGWAEDDDTRIVDGVRRLPSGGTPEQHAFLHEAYTRLNLLYFEPLLPHDFPIRISNRMASRFGHMRYHTLRDGTRTILEIALNQTLFGRGHESNLLDTLLHEMTHVEAWLRHGDCGHGDAWKLIARRVGCEPRACSAQVIRRRRDAGALTRVPSRSILPRLPQRGAA